VSNVCSVVASSLPFSFPLPSPQHQSDGAAVVARVTVAIRSALMRMVSPTTTPPHLARALEHAVFPGGGRLRPQLCVLASIATGDHDSASADAAAAAIELVHCASLVHDDMPCFDNADTRRGLPSVHKAFGQPIALLVGDALIVHAFAEVARASSSCASDLVATLAEATGSVRGIIAGQAWESEPDEGDTSITLDEYHRAKTASLFEAAAAMGAITSGADPAPWRAFGEALGRAYQAADDLADVAGDPTKMGKPTGRDEVLGRPSVVRGLGVQGARARARKLIEESRDLLPAGSGGGSSHPLYTWMARLANRMEIGS
jgi:geranylgeranyl diphosphate synthase type II